MFGNRIDGYRNSKRMAINEMVKRLCKEEDVGYVDLWDSFVGTEEMYLRDGLHLKGLSHQSCVLTESARRPGKNENAMVRAVRSPGAQKQLRGISVGRREDS